MRSPIAPVLPRRLFWLLAMSLVLIIPGQALGQMKPVRAGQQIALNSGEGLLLLAVDSNVPLRSVRLNREGKMFAAGGWRQIDAGRTHRLFVVPAGRYQWRDAVVFYGGRFALSDDPEFGFDVAPGKITYPGDLLFRQSGWLRARILVYNRGLLASDWLRENHPALEPDMHLAYSGHYPDPFLEFHREQMAIRGKQKLFSELSLQAPPAAPSIALDPELLWHPGRLRRVAMNPSGSLVVVVTLEPGSDWMAELIDLESEVSTLLVRSAAQIEDVAWADDHTALLSVPTNGPSNTVYVARWDKTDAGAGAATVSVDRIEKQGVVVDPLPNDPKKILMSMIESDGDWSVFAVNISSRSSIRGFRPKYRDRLNKGLENDFAWLSDQSGQLRVALTQVEGDVVIMRRESDGWLPVIRLEDLGDFQPMQLASDGRRIVGSSDFERGQRDLVVFDMDQRKITETLFSRPGVDVERGLFDAHGDAIGAGFYRDGALVNEYFAGDAQVLSTQLSRAFSGQTVITLDRSLDGNQRILWVDAGNSPPKLYHFNAGKRSAALIGENMPWLADAAFQPTEVLSVRGGDGQPLQAFLTLPASADRPPVVVYPHGGPIGVSDNLRFNREVQFLAAHGYAVLQVNFRGSDGYGREFREAGHRQLGSLIEDDIHAALEQVLDAHPVDRDRVCVVGESYGGYSALMSAVRWPDRFRCVVSIAGVSDLPLQFTASDTGRSRQGRRELERIVGNPNEELPALIATSPVYAYDKIVTPVMLAHGREDRRVDLEHSRRMQAMLTMAGRAPVGLIFDEEGHSFATPENQRKLWDGVAGFLHQHLHQGRSVQDSASEPGEVKPDR